MESFGASFTAGYLAELTASLTARALDATGRRVREAIKGTQKEQALYRCVQAAIAAMLTRVSHAAPAELTQLASIFEPFFTSPDTAKEIGALLQGKPLDLDELSYLFESAGYDEKTLPGIGFRQAITTFEAAFLLSAADEPDLQGTIQTAQLLEQTQLQRELLSSVKELVAFLQRARLNSLGIESGKLLAENSATGRRITYRWRYREDLLQQDEVQTRRLAYLNHLFDVTRQLSLAGVDPKTATDPDAQLYLEAVYTALLTQAADEKELLAGKTGARGESEPRQLSALAQLDRHPHLVLLGDPGGGKSTFANFVTMCLAGELTGRAEANLQHLTAPVPGEGDDAKAKERQPWSHGALLPVRVILRDFAARGLPPANQPATAECLWNFIASNLDAPMLGDYAHYLRAELLEKGGLIVLDGLDEVPEAEQRRESIKNAVESFAAAFFRCRILVTSRTYAYQQQSWRLKDFTPVTLAPFNAHQIRRFIESWYRHVAAVRHQHASDAAGRADQLKRAIFSSERLRELAERPLLLTLMASLHAWRGGSLPEKREELYADTVTLLLESWEKQRIVYDAQGTQMMQPSLAEWLKVDRDQMRRLLNELAYEAHASQPELTGTADIPEDKLVARLTSLSKNPDVRPVRLVEYLSERAGILVPHGNGVFTFPHRTFQEYLAACYLTDCNYPEDLAGLVREEPNRWREIALLAGAKAARGAVSTIWLLVDALTYEEPDGDAAARARQTWGTLIAGQALAEVIDPTHTPQQHKPKLDSLKQRHIDMMRDSTLPAVERATAGRTLGRLGDPRPQATDIDAIELCLVPAGKFIHKTGRSDEGSDVVLPYDFWIGRHQITNAHFSVFVADGGYKEKRYWTEAAKKRAWIDGRVIDLPPFADFADEGSEGRDSPVDPGPPFNLPNHPVTSINLFEATAFCRWLTERMQQWGFLPEDWILALPNDLEFEKAGRGGLKIPVSPYIVSLRELKEHLANPVISDTYDNPNKSRRYPWGDKVDPNRANCIESGIGLTCAIGCFVDGASLYGVEALIGEVWELIRSGKAPISAVSVTPFLKPQIDERAMIIGGYYSHPSLDSLHCSHMVRGFFPTLVSTGIGMRIVAIPASVIEREMEAEASERGKGKRRRRAK